MPFSTKVLEESGFHYIVNKFIVLDCVRQESANYYLRANNRFYMLKWLKQTNKQKTTKVSFNGMLKFWEIKISVSVNHTLLEYGPGH